MALTTVRKRDSLAAVSVLAPERYDPRRALSTEARESVRLGDVARIERRIIQPSSNHGRCLVLDTSDAREGIVIGRKTPVGGREIGSAKKVVEPSDVIISRLRPYLRQVAFVDDAIPHAASSTITCSTEFFVLRSRDDRSIAFLVPFLLSPQVQQVLAASQEGGHHPRFAEPTLVTLPVPAPLLKLRDMWSERLQHGVRLYRESETTIGDMVAKAEQMMSSSR
jgi:hypothetical protein